MRSVEVRIEALKFDLQNPRFESLSDQREVLQKIVSDQNDKLAVLAHDIATQGINPIERMILIEDNGNKNSYIMLEGNRRLAALQLLSNPVLCSSLVINPLLRKKLQKYAEQFDRASIEPIDGALFDSREEASHWIELRHTGENAGAGIVGWDGLATARFRGNNVSLQAIEFVKEYVKLDKKALDDFKVTNLDRLLGDPYVRDVLGIETRNRKLGSCFDAKEVLKGLRYLISEIASERVKVPIIRSKADRKKYIDALPDSAKPNKKNIGEFWQLDAPQNKSIAAPKRAYQPSIVVRNTLIPRDCKLQIPDIRIAAIFKELRRLKVDEFPNAISVLFRVFLEFTTDHYISQEKIDGVTEHTSLFKKIQATETSLRKSGVTSDNLKPLRVLVSSNDNVLSCDTFHSYVHNRKMAPIGSELLTAWDRSQIFFETIWS